MFKLKRNIRAWGVVFGILGVAGLFVSAAAYAQSVTQSYINRGQVLYNGMIVSLRDNNAAEVEALDKQNAKDMLGIVTAANDAPVSLSTVTDQQQVYVATTGKFNVLVSTEEGPIKVGDFITISSLHGIGMKATTTDEIVIGKALEAFDGKTVNAGETQVKDDKGRTRKVTLGRVQVDISVAHNPFYQNAKVDGVPAFLAKAAQVVTDSPVGAMRIYAAAGILVIALIVAGFVIYSGVRSGMVAIGRNPLAKKSITRGLIQVILTALIIFIIGLIAVYLLLKI